MDDETRSLSGTDRPGVSPELRQWGPFELRERVGQGGFGEVYRAWDPTLEREVAVKLLLRGAAHEQLQAAVLREARAMAKVTHPNVVPIYGVREYDGRVGMWSAFVRGKTLAELLKINGPFGAAEVANIGLDLCRALSAVHAAGLLHGDIKARNAMREEGGRILLMDFGLTQERDSQTFVSGTPGYIAPELRRGSQVSVRSDIYALGVLLYHLLTGKYPPAEEDSTWNLLQIRPDLSPELVRAIHTAIDPDPARRFATPAHMASALAGAESQIALPVRRMSRKWLWALTAIPVLAFGLYFKYFRVPAEVHTQYEKAHDVLQHYYRPHALVDVIPLLEKLTHDAPNFAAGFSDLGRANFLQYRLQRDSKYIEPTKQASFRAIELDSTLAAPRVTLAMLYTLLGNNDLAEQELNAALKADPLNSEAWGARAELRRRQGRPGEQELALLKAIELSPNEWRWHTVLADLYSSTNRMEQALLEDQEAIRLSPDNAIVYNNFGIDLRNAGKLVEARKNLQEAIKLAPDFDRYTSLGMIDRELGDNARAADMFQRAVDLKPNDYRAWGSLAEIYKRQGFEASKWRPAYEKSIALGEELRKTKPTDPVLLADLGVMYAAIGNSDRALPLVRQAAAREPENARILFSAGLAYELSHRRVDALRWIGLALNKGLPRKAVEVVPDLTDLRSDRNYLAMLETLR
ncbi:MAG TPA: protein kinase [Candidatus Solibacter sp.]|nr:protein kinase [Candidatus Solibacter sp.]